MAEDLKFELTFTSNGEVVLKNIKAAVDSSKSSFERAAPAINNFNVKAQQIRPLLGAAASTLTQVEGGVGLLASGFTSLLFTGLNPVGLGIAALTVSTGFAINKFQEYKKEAGELESRLKTLAQVQRDASNLIKDIGARGRIAENDTSLTNLIEQQERERRAIAQHFKALAEAEHLSSLERQEIKFRGTEALSALDNTFSRERSKIANAEIEAAGKIQQAIQQEISTLQFEGAAIGKSGAALAELTLAQQLNAINTRILAGEHGAMLHSLANETVATYKLKTAYDQLKGAATITAGGRGAISQFQQSFGVELDIEKNIKGFNLAKTFVSVFNAFKDDPREQGNLRAAFNSFVQQALQNNIMDPQELLLKQGLGSMDLERLKSSLQGPLKSAFEATNVAGEQWDKSFEDKFGNFIKAAQNAGLAVLEIEAPLKRVTDGLTKEFALKIENAPALKALRDVDDAIDALYQKILSPPSLVIPAQFSASPARPFSEFLPFMNATFNQLSAMVRSSTPDVVMSVPDLPARMREIASIEREIYLAQFRAATILGNGGGLGAAGYERNSLNALVNNTLTPRLEDLKFALAADLSRGGGGASGGGGGGVTVNIDMRNSSLTPANLDDHLLPALERAIIRATGQDPQIRIVN